MPWTFNIASPLLRCSFVVRLDSDDRFCPREKQSQNHSYHIHHSMQLSKKKETEKKQRCAIVQFFIASDDCFREKFC